jgi:hypothetical protein
MASIITATTTSGLTQSADNSGVLQLASGTGNLVTVPAVTGTAMVSGNMPAFSAYAGSNQTISNNTATKIQFNTELFDTNNCFDNATNYRFTPTVAGYYQINLNFLLTGTNGRNYEISGLIYKNGSSYISSLISVTITNGTSMSRNFSAVIYFNGTTDYVEGYTSHYDYTSTSTMTLIGGTTYTTFSGSMVRSA